jgi:hypothetical protein
MALQKTVTLNNGLQVQNAYIRIDTVSGYKSNITISVNSYVSQQDFKDGKGYLEQKFYNFIPNVEDDSKNIFKQGYYYLKTLDEYKDSIDILEEGQTV